MGKLRLKRLVGLAKVQNYWKPKPKTGKAIPLWTPWKSLNQCHWDFISQIAEECFHDFLRRTVLPQIQVPTSGVILMRMRRNNLGELIR